MDKKKIIKFTDLIAWQQAHNMVLMIYKITTSFPSEEKYGLVSQLRRAIVSITSNIAEGFGRGTINDKAHFYRMAKTSLAEVENQSIIARDLSFISKETFTRLETQRTTVDKLIAGLIKSARNK